MTLLPKVVTILLNFLINDKKHQTRCKAQSFIRNNTLEERYSLAASASVPPAWSITIS